MSNLDRKLNSRFYHTYISQDDYEDLREKYEQLRTRADDLRLCASAYRRAGWMIEEACAKQLDESIVRMEEVL